MSKYSIHVATAITDNNNSVLQNWHGHHPGKWGRRSGSVASQSTDVRSLAWQALELPFATCGSATSSRSWGSPSPQVPRAYLEGSQRLCFSISGNSENIKNKKILPQYFPIKIAPFLPTPLKLFQSLLGISKLPLFLSFQLKEKLIAI